VASHVRIDPLSWAVLLKQQTTLTRADPQHNVPPTPTSRVARKSAVQATIICRKGPLAGTHLGNHLRRRRPWELIDLKDSTGAFDCVNLANNRG